MSPLVLSDVFGTHRKVLGKDSSSFPVSFCGAGSMHNHAGECQQGGCAALRSTRVQGQALGARTCNPLG